MVTKKYQVEKTTIDKINKLFTYRRLKDLLKSSGLDKNEEFVSDLVNLQYQIYRLDGYLESQWALHKKDIALYWEAIKLSLENMGFKQKQITAFVKEIEAYQEMEKNCRKDKWPTKESMKKFYVTKSCDVRLIRHLIYRAHPDLNKLWKEDAWEYYDIITEINDDIADVQEDINTYNGNRFLISILRKGSDKTNKEYRDYLTAITTKAAKHFDAKGGKGKNKQLGGWVTARSQQTLKLLDAQLKSKILDKLSSSLLLSQMK